MEEGAHSRLLHIAEAALARYPVGETRCTFLGESGGAAFGVDTRTGRRAYLLKVHTHPRGGRAVLESGLSWLAALAQETDLTVQEPVRDAEGYLAVEVHAPGTPGETTYCSLVRWVAGEHFPGAPSWREHRPVPCPPQWAGRLGEMTAKLHRHASGWALPAGFSTTAALWSRRHSERL
jgi:Ser/Thr protein kinase RdoA (MazF antagonist)